MTSTVQIQEYLRVVYNQRASHTLSTCTLYLKHTYTITHTILTQYIVFKYTYFPFNLHGSITKLILYQCVYIIIYTH